jgi:hypothetical protein
LNSLIDALNGLLWIFKLGSQLAVKLQEIRLDFRDTFLKFLEYIDSLRKGNTSLRLWQDLESIAPTHKALYPRVATG